VPVLCESTTRMTLAANDRTSEHGKNYFDSRLMSDKEIYRQSSSPRNRRRWVNDCPPSDSAKVQGQTRVINRPLHVLTARSMRDIATLQQSIRASPT
jgi:hypothetical protein